jgi:hypothetical protein
MAVFLGDKYEIHMEDDYIHAIEKRGRRSVLYIPKESPDYERFEAYFASPLDIDEIIAEYLKIIGGGMWPIMFDWLKCHINIAC